MEVVQNEMDIEYNRKYHGVGPNMEVNAGYFLFQASIMSLYDADSEEKPLRTGWLRDDNNGVVASSWEDYALINRFCVKNNLSLAAGDELLELISLIAKRHKLHINIPKTMRAVRYVLLLTLMFLAHILCTLMFLTISLTNAYVLAQQSNVLLINHINLLV